MTDIQIEKFYVNNFVDYKETHVRKNYIQHTWIIILIINIDKKKLRKNK